MTATATVCPDCGQPIINRGAHMERCTGPRPEPVAEVAGKIAAGHPFTDVDAVRVARAFLEAAT